MTMATFIQQRSLLTLRGITGDGHFIQQADSASWEVIFQDGHALPKSRHFLL